MSNVRATHVRTDLADALSGEQLAVLRQRLDEERSAILGRVAERLAIAAPMPSHHPDEMDEASANQDLALLFRLAEKEQKLLSEIDAARERFDLGTYGYCEGTGEAIGYRRLLLRPWARFSVQYKESLERQEARA